MFDNDIQKAITVSVTQINENQQDLKQFSLLNHFDILNFFLKYCPCVMYAFSKQNANFQICLMIIS
jgi:hypothetical protein